MNFNNTWSDLSTTGQPLFEDYKGGIVSDALGLHTMTIITGSRFAGRTRAPLLMLALARGALFSVPAQFFVTAQEPVVKTMQLRPAGALMVSPARTSWTIAGCKRIVQEGGYVPPDLLRNQINSSSSGAP